MKFNATKNCAFQVLGRTLLVVLTLGLGACGGGGGSYLTTVRTRSYIFSCLQPKCTIRHKREASIGKQFAITSCSLHPSESSNVIFVLTPEFCPDVNSEDSIF